MTASGGRELEQDGEHGDGASDARGDGASDSRGWRRGAASGVGGFGDGARAALGRLAFVALVALAAGARLWRLDASCLWFDELFGLHAARLAWGELLHFVALDLIHPPLFYLLLKIWTAAGGDSARWLRLLPVVCALAALLPLWLLGRELRLPARTLRLALLLSAASGYLIKYAQEVRMYAPLLLAASASLWLFARLCNPPDEEAPPRTDDELAQRTDNELTREAGDEPTRRTGNAPSRIGGAARPRTRPTWPRGRQARLGLAALTLVNLLLVYTHYFGWLLVALELVFVLTRARWRARAFAVSAAFTVVCFAPWAWALARAAGEGGGAFGAGGPVSGGVGGLAQNIGWAMRPGPLQLFEPYLLLHEPFRFQRHTHEPAVLPFSVFMAALLFGPALLALARRTLARKINPAAEDVGAQAPDGRARAEVFRRATELKEAEPAPPARERFAVGFLAFFSFAPTLAAFALSWALPHSVWGARHLVVLAPAYLLLAAHALATLRPRWLSAAAGALLGCWMLLAAAGQLARRPAPHVWCAWEPLAREAVRAEFAGGEAPATTTDDAAHDHAPDATHGETHEDTHGEIKLYAFEDLAAYHLWHALAASGESRLRVYAVRNFPGASEDRAFFLPRGFSGVRVIEARDVLREESFWIAFRDAAGAREPAPLKYLSERGYEIDQRFERSATGQTVFMLRAKKRD
jgi:Dolichyl-phosphate-mannose-protein mannosyltransferase